MLRFDNDYTQGACQEVLDALVRTNWEQTGGYGKDEYCRQAEERIRSLCQAPEARVHFLTGGTQTNLTLIAAALRPHQGVLTLTLAGRTGAFLYTPSVQRRDTT